jgi:hypothetical protein
MSDTDHRRFEDASREDARSQASTAMALLARAMNHCDNPELPYRYTAEVQSRFVDLAIQIVRLVETGDIEPNPEHAQHLKALAARNDAPLQTMLLKLSKRAARRPRHG